MKITINSDKDFRSILQDDIRYKRVRVSINQSTMVLEGDFVGFISEVYNNFNNEGIVLTNRYWVATRVPIQFDLIKEIEVL